ncbi:MAG TPA: amidohydrolase family protein [Rhizomicrobium sp.]|nr:amidohydrolase family protein [Rhizomicrobium sp.]
MLHISAAALGRAGKNGALMTAAALLALLLPAASPLFAQSPPDTEADLLIANGKIVDGSGGPWRQGNVAIKGDTIVYVGDAPVRAKKIIDAKGQAVSPGFIDMHAHSEFGLSLDGRGLGKITQGVTTEVLGEHLSAGPVLGPAVDDPMMITPPVKRSWTTLGGFFDFLTKKGIGPNVVSYVGAGQVRASVMGYENRTPTAAEMGKMKELIAQAMQEGAFGLSAGLVYVPNSFDTTAQMIELAKVAAGYGGIYSVHMRAGEGNAGLLETIQIAKGAHIPTEIFHVGMTVAHDPNFARIVEQARSEGIDITANAYPYTVGWTYVRQLIPVWAQEGDASAITARLKQPEVRARVVKEMQQKPGQYAAWTVSSANLKFDGHTFKQIADSMHESVEEAMVDFLVAQKAEGFQIGPADPSMDQKEAETFKYPWVDVGSDGIALPAGVHTSFGRPHPRSFGTFTHILADVVRNRHVLTLEEAVRKMTSQPANRLGIKDRGQLREGMKADVVVFNPETVRDTSTYAKPDQYSQGIAWVLVNGMAVVADGKPTNALPGRVLHGPGYKRGSP